MRTKKPAPPPITDQTWVDFGLPRPITEVRVTAGRRWRVDFLWPCETIGRTLAVEVHGGMWAGMAHASSPKDFAKGHYATMRGWFRMEFTPEQVRSGYAAAVVRCFLGGGSLDAELPPDPEDRRKATLKAKKAARTVERQIKAAKALDKLEDARKAAKRRSRTDSMVLPWIGR